MEIGAPGADTPGAQLRFRSCGSPAVTAHCDCVPPLCSSQAEQSAGQAALLAWWAEAG